MSKRYFTVPPSSEITAERYFFERRRLLAAIGTATTLGLMAGRVQGAEAEPTATGTPIGLQPNDKPTPWADVTGYNNFYEFGTDKTDPAANASSLRPRPWTLQIDGLVSKPASYHLDEFLKPLKMEDRIYRHRCVEAWSMVVPWQGIMLAEVLKWAEPNPSARYVAFTTLHDPAQMPGQRGQVLDWPYTEGLRLDEAMQRLSAFVRHV